MSFLNWLGVGKNVHRSRPVKLYRPRLEEFEDRSLPSAYSMTVLADAPVAYWRLGEASGPFAFDATGHGHTGTYMMSPGLGTPGAIAGDSDTAVRFDGINDHVRFNQVLGGNFTLEAWIRTTANSLPGNPLNPQAFQGNGLIWSDVGGSGNDYILAILNNR